MNSENISGLEPLLKGKTEPQLKNIIFDIVSRFPETFDFILRREQEGGKIDVNSELAQELWAEAEGIISKFNNYGGGPEDEEEEAYGKIEKLCGFFPSLP